MLVQQAMYVLFYLMCKVLGALYCQYHQVNVTLPLVVLNAPGHFYNTMFLFTQNSPFGLSNTGEDPGKLLSSQECLL